MSADAGSGPIHTQTQSGAEALYFASGAHTLFGWLNRPHDRRQPERGVVICRPFGYEGLCSHRGVRALAEACAARGWPALRFDYSGTGDSGEIDPTADQIEHWTNDVVAAVAAMQRLTGVGRVCLVGVRIGALLAGLAARRCPLADALVLIAPVLTGRQLLKDIRITRLAASLLPGDSDKGSASPGSVEISGFHLSAATLLSLQQAELPPSMAAAGAAMLVIDGSSLPVARAWIDRVTAAGEGVTYQVLPGMIEMIFTAPQFAAVPQQMVAAVCAWLSKRPLNSITLPPLGQPPSAAAMPLQLPHGSGEQVWITERPVWFGHDRALFAVVTEPRAGELRRRAVILLNGGADVHIGPSAVSVELARDWARRGYFVMRMDFAGIGDSCTRAGRPDNDVFPPAAVDDMRAAVEYLRREYGVKELTIAGMCSGAYHALQAAIAGLPVDRILMVNPQNYFWREGMTIHDMQVAELVSQPPGGPLRRKVISVDWWRRALTGKVDVGYVARRAAKRVALRAGVTLRDVARALRVRLPGDLGWDLEEIAARGVRIVFVFARGEPGIDLLRLQAGISLKRLGERVRLHIIDDADHVFSKRGPRQVLKKVLSEELYLRAPSTVLSSQLVAQATAK